MLSWFDKMEKKVGRYAISNLTLYLLIAYGIGYMTRFLMPELLQWLTLEPGLILKGQIWRIVSWIFVAPAEKPIFCLWSGCIILWERLSNVRGEHFGIMYILFRECCLL